MPICTYCGEDYEEKEDLGIYCSWAAMLMMMKTGHIPTPTSQSLDFCEIDHYRKWIIEKVKV